MRAAAAEGEEKPEMKFQVELPETYVSLIARNGDERREFMLLALHGISFLLIEGAERSVQLVISDVQVDNNIHSDGSKQLYPFVLYPKDVLRVANQDRRGTRKDFFNLAITLRNDSPVTYIYKAQFLLQSCVVLVDEELVGWLLKFIQVFANKLGKNLTDLHPVLQRRDIAMEVLGRDSRASERTPLLRTDARASEASFEFRDTNIDLA